MYAAQNVVEIIMSNKFSTIIHIGNNFICPKCLTFTACRSGQRIYFHLTLNIDEDAVEKERCDMIKNGWLPQCKFDVERCSVNLTSFNSSDYLMAQCPLKNSSSAYHIDSLAQQIGPAEALESCTSKKLYILYADYSNIVLISHHVCPAL